VKKQILTILALAAISVFLSAAVFAGDDGCQYSKKKAEAKATTTAVSAKAEGEAVLLNVSNMTCGGCVKHVTKVLSEVEGVEDVTVSLEKGTAEVICDAKTVEADMLTKAVVKAGYPATLATATEETKTTAHKCSSTCAKKGCDPTACGMKKSAKKGEDSK
jgi:copper chaperone CopZ